MVFQDGKNREGDLPFVSSMSTSSFSNIKASSTALSSCDIDPFCHVAVDIFSSLKKTKARNQYVLAVIDYARKWPKAFPLENTPTKAIIECLIESISRIRIPKKILTNKDAI